MKPEEFLILAHGKRCVPALLGLERILEELLRVGPLRKGAADKG
jgi:hypothetical protein